MRKCNVFIFEPYIINFAMLYHHITKICALKHFLMHSIANCKLLCCKKKHFHDNIFIFLLLNLAAFSPFKR